MLGTIWNSVRTAVTSALSHAAFRLGRLDTATQHYQPLASSGDLATTTSNDLAHRRARDQVRNNPHCRKGTDAWQDLIVGCGLQTLADPFEPWLDLATLTPSDLDERLSYALESDELFAEWADDPKQFSADGRFSAAGLQRMIVSELVATGSCFLLECWRKSPGSLVPLCYQLLEYEQLDRTVNRLAAPGQNKVVEGIEIDQYGREVAYYLYNDHPYDGWSGTLKSERVEATRCTHITLPLRPSQHHGITWLHASGQPEIDRDKFLAAELQTAAKVAGLALVFKRTNPARNNMGPTFNGASEDQFGNPQIKLGGSPYAAVIGQDEAVEVVESQRPNPDAEPFLRILDRYSAGGMGLSYYTLTGDYGNTAYSSVRAARQDEDAHVKPLQQWFGTTVALPIRKRFNAIAAAMNLFSTIDFGEFTANQRRYQRFDAMGPGRDLLDPEAETNAAIGRLRSGLSNLRIECAKRGLHWVRVLRQIKLENQLTSVLGVVLDFSKGQGGQVTGNTRDAAGAAQNGAKA